MSSEITPYHLVKTYNASNFFNEFSYYSPRDNPKGGAKPWLDRPQLQDFEAFTPHRCRRPRRSRHCYHLKSFLHQRCRKRHPEGGRQFSRFPRRATQFCESQQSRYLWARYPLGDGCIPRAIWMRVCPRAATITVLVTITVHPVSGVHTGVKQTLIHGILKEG